MKAYKVFNPDWTCRGYKFEVGKTYTVKGKAIMCENGFHACKKVSDCFSYYSFDPKNKVAEVELIGDILGMEEDKQCSKKIKIVREVSWEEVLVLANSGNGNSGYRNSGEWNSGDCNSGDCNSGDRNSGECNSGDWNSGEWNSGNRNSGYFCTTTPKEINIFNKKCELEMWDNATKPQWIYEIVLTEWIQFSDMTDDEKRNDKDAYLRDGYLKKIAYKDAWKNAYNKASQEDIELTKKLPNFDTDIFEEITGLRI